MGLLIALLLIACGLLAAPDLVHRWPKLERRARALSAYQQPLSVAALFVGVVGCLWGIVRMLGVLGMVIDVRAAVGALLAFTAAVALTGLGVTLSGDLLPARMPDLEKEARARRAVALVRVRQAVLARAALALGALSLVAVFF